MADGLGNALLCLEAGGFRRYGFLPWCEPFFARLLVLFLHIANRLDFVIEVVQVALRVNVYLVGVANHIARVERRVLDLRGAFPLVG